MERKKIAHMKTHAPHSLTSAQQLILSMMQRKKSKTETKREHIISGVSYIGIVKYLCRCGQYSFANQITYCPLPLRSTTQFCAFFYIKKKHSILWLELKHNKGKMHAIGIAKTHRNRHSSFQKYENRKVHFWIMGFWIRLTSIKTILMLRFFLSSFVCFVWLNPNCTAASVVTLKIWWFSMCNFFCIYGRCIELSFFLLAQSVSHDRFYCIRPKHSAK